MSVLTDFCGPCSLCVAVVDHFYIALFFALEQTHCALVACDSESVTAAFYSAFFYIHPSGVLTVLSGCCMAGAT